ncbi:DUF1847 domain-containing protein [Methanolobus sp. ZRKC3]|uniref:DUF1847 domain-containing protein n=1 Tax=Methanolobus sp. ZRKC3 TaxID=3125786 RepID=UPI00324BA787
MKCALCYEKECRGGKDCTGITECISYERDDLGSMKASAAIEARYYMQKTRLEELILYSREMGYERIGIAFCVGLEKEAEIIHRILDKYFDVYSVCCKVCGIEKGEYGLEKLNPCEFDPTCNPIGQAMMLDKKNTQLNIIIGLCMGHDILFTQKSKAPVTTLIVKDRVLGHNPAAAIYSGYYLKNRFSLDE